jgi:glyoxylase-like metal-dependent hydrolase (beta-lactamase superfamily II)
MNQPGQKPKVVELRKDIFQLRSEMPGSHVYLVKGNTKNVLIDTGHGSNYSNLTLGLAERGLNPSQIHLIILTHEHFDHTGASVYFRETTVIAAHPLAANKIFLGDEFVMHGKYLDSASKPFRADIWLQDNSIVDLGNYKLRMMYTPGHSSGCICLYGMNDGLLFTGDTVLAGGALSGIMPSGNVSDYIDSLQRLSALRIEEFYPGHGKISQNAGEDLARALEHSHRLFAESKALFEMLDSKASWQRYLLDIKSTDKPTR